MRLTLIVLLSCLWAARPAAAQEQLFTARVEQIVLLPIGVEACQPACQTPASPNKDGMARICISNSGACQKTTLKVEQVFLGSLPQTPVTIDTRQGEFSPTTFPTTRELILVRMVDGGHVGWSVIEDRGGQFFFDARRLPVVGGIQTRPLVAGSDRMVELDRLLERVHAK